MHESHRKATWLELFYDLIFVVAIAKATHVLAHVHHGHIGGEMYLKYVLIMIPIWWAWTGHTLFANRFDADDILQRGLTMLQMLCAVVLSVFINPDFDPNYLGFLLSYAAIRALVVVMYFRAATVCPKNSHVSLYLAKGFAVGVVISLTSLFFSGTIRYIVLYLGIGVDLIVPLLGRRHLKTMPVESHHLPERYALLTIIVLGESVLSLSASFKEIQWTGASILTGLAGFLLLCSIWWIYFENIERLVSGKQLSTGQAIIYSHLFVYMGLGMLANAIRFAMLPELKLFDFKLLTCAGAFSFSIAVYSVHVLHLNHTGRRLFFQHVSGFLVGLLVLAFLAPTEVVMLCGTALLFALYAVFDEIRLAKAGNHQ